MPKPPHLPRPKPKSLVQEKSDFTAEGSPPPGKVGASLPATKDKPEVPPVSGGKLNLKPTAPRR